MFAKNPVVYLLFGLIAGIVFRHNFFVSSEVILLSFSFVFTAFLGLSYYLYKTKSNHYSFGILFVLLSFLLGIFLKQNTTELDKKSHFSKFILQQNQFEGIVIDQYKSDVYNDKFVVQLHKNATFETIGKVLVYVPKKKHSNMKIGNAIWFKTVPKFIENYSNPNEFDYTAYLNNQQIYHEFKIKNANEIRYKTALNFYSRIHFIKQKLLESFPKNAFTNDNLALLKGLLLGEKSEISKNTTAIYAQLGILHILAISGLHIALIYSVLLRILQPLKKYKNGNQLIFIISIIVLWFYALIAGFSASIVRAVVMFSVISFVKLLKRDADTSNVLALSAFFLLLVNPNYIFDIGFVLSFSAVMGIIYAKPVLLKWGYHKNYFIRTTKELLIISFFAQLAVLPITIYFFGSFSFLFLLANLVAIPLSNLVILLGFLALFVQLLSKDLGFYLFKTIDCILTLMNYLSEKLASFDRFYIHSIPFHWLLFVALSILIVFIYVWINNMKYKYLKNIFFGIIAFQLLFIFVSFRKNSDQLFILKSKVTTLLFSENNQWICMTSDSLQSNKVVSSFMKTQIGKKQIYKPLNNTIFYKKRMLIVDSLAQFQTNNKAEIVVLTQNAKINLERLIHYHKPKQIIADATNYGSVVEMWKTTCKQQKIPFHSIHEKGFYVLE